MNPPLVVFAPIAAFVLLIAVIRFLKRCFIRSPAQTTRFASLGLLGMAEVLVWVACIASLCALAPHPVTFLIVALMVASAVTASSLRYREEVNAMNRSLGAAIEVAANVPEVLDQLASGFRSRLSLQAKRCVRRISRGEPLSYSIRRAKLPINADIVARLVVPEATVVGAEGGLNAVGINGVDVSSEGEFERWDSKSRIVQQWTYLAVTVLLACLIGGFIHTFLVPNFQSITKDFSGRLPTRTGISHGTLQFVAALGNFLAAFFVGWLLLAALIRWLPLWSIPWVPWFGRNAINQWRAEVLLWLQRGMRANQSDSQLLESAAKSTRVRWIRSRCRLVNRMVDGGVSLPTAMSRAKLVSSKEERWLSCAEKNGSLPSALGRLSGDILRHHVHRWDLRMAWLVPLITVMIGGYIMVHSVYVFEFLLTIIAQFS